MAQAVPDARDRHPLAEAFSEAAQQCCYPSNDDFNGATQEGARFYQTTTRNGVRSSAAAAYLKPAQGVPIQHQCGHDHDRREGCRHDP
jgi:choline dehydrogenase